MANSFQILCDKILAVARTHSEKDKLRAVYHSGDDWAIAFAEMQQVKQHYDRILNPVEGK
jgi:hypothetical protein